jgi:hypothetical protein
MIVKKSEKQGDGLFDVLVCGHAVAVDGEWRSIRYRRARACPTCAEMVAKYAAEVEAKDDALRPQERKTGSEGFVGETPAETLIFRGSQRTCR